jgi:hypothetical protein
VEKQEVKFLNQLVHAPSRSPEDVQHRGDVDEADDEEEIEGL